MNAGAGENPLLDLLVEAEDCADRLALATDPHRLLADAVRVVRHVTERPDWFPQFKSLVEAMASSSFALNWED